MRKTKQQKERERAIILKRLKLRLRGKLKDKPEIHRGQIDLDIFYRKLRRRKGIYSFRFGGMEYRSPVKMQIIKTLVRLKILRV